MGNRILEGMMGLRMESWSNGSWRREESGIVCGEIVKGGVGLWEEKKCGCR